MTHALATLEYSVTFDDGPAADWQLLAFHCEEELNGGCRITLEISTDALDAELDEFLGATCEVTTHRGDSVHCFFGVVLRVDLLGQVDHHTVLRIRAVSALELAQQRRHSKIWQELSVMDIVVEVLDEALGDYSRTTQVDAASRGSAPRTYCVQYRETDYDYVHRLLEEAGVSYYLHHDPDVGHEVAVLCDDNAQYPSAENVDGGDEFPLVSHNPDQADTESLQSLEWRQQLTTTAVLRGDFDWNTPTDLLSSEAGDADARGRVRRLYAHGQRRFESDDLEERAQDLSDALALAGETARGTSNSPGLRPGMRFTTDAHSLDGAPGEYIVTRVSHRGASNRSGTMGGRGETVVYSNSFECVPSSAVLRPRHQTPKPRVRGPQTATVVGDDEIHTDAHGRIQVQFHWEEHPSFATDASCWIRCAQSWAQGAWGAQFIPRVGMEVVVEFLEGNPDRPLVTGCVYNGEHEPPFALPGSSTQSGWRTNSSPGGGGSNELRFDDAAGAEEVFIHGQRDWNVVIENNTSVSTGNDETHSVGNDRTKTVDNNQSSTIGVDKSISVGSNHSETIGADMALTVGKNQTITIGANQTITVGSALSETIGSTCTQTVTAAKATTVGAAFAITVGGAMATTVMAASAEIVGAVKSVTVGGASSHSVIGAYKCSAATISHSAKKAVQISAGTKLSAKGKSSVGLSTDGPFMARAKTKFTIDAGDEFVISCGSSVLSMKKNGEIVIKGKKITVKGSSKITLKGGKIHEN